MSVQRVLALSLLTAAAAAILWFNHDGPLRGLTFVGAAYFIAVTTLLAQWRGRPWRSLLVIFAAFSAVELAFSYLAPGSQRGVVYPWLVFSGALFWQARRLRIV
jgi:hypothetical protein